MLPYHQVKYQSRQGLHAQLGMRISDLFANNAECLNVTLAWSKDTLMLIITTHP